MDLSTLENIKKDKTMAKQATDAEVMEYLWPTERRVQGGQAMNNPKITSVGIAAALLLFSALLFGERAEASYDKFPAGTYTKGGATLVVSAMVITT